jgi:hypothetical protein
VAVNPSQILILRPDIAWLGVCFIGAVGIAFTIVALTLKLDQRHQALRATIRP